MRSAARAVVMDQRGAAMVFGIFFAVFLFACVYKLHGLLEVMLFRQHQQDAADASAFASAVVHARGMNLIALINMTMAAVLSVLVGLRLAQTVVIVGISLCAALAYPTMGSSLSYVPKLAQTSTQLKRVTDKVSDTLPNILSALHIAGKAISVVIPLGSNARVIDVALQHGQDVGFALPSRFTLPVEDGKFIDLCRHAGVLAADIAMLPFKPIVSGRVEDAIGKATGAIAQAAPDWFCGKQAQGKKPDLDPGGDLDPITLPVLPRQKRCNELSEKFQRTDHSDAQLEAEVEEACNAASVEYLASSPGENGLSRDGEKLCPSDCDVRPRPTCPPTGTELCDQAQSDEVDRHAYATRQSSIVASGPGSPYGQRLKLAHQQCDPAAPHSHPLGGFHWVEQTITRQYVWNPVTKRFEKGGEVPHPTTKRVTRKDKEGDLPCGPGGVVGKAWGTKWDEVCEDEGQCSDAQGQARSSGPCIPLNADPYWQTHQRVIGILRCVEQRPHEKVETPDLDMEEELNKSKKSKKKQKNTSPFQLDKEVWLGGSDFQQRAIVVRSVPDIVGAKAVKVARWGARDDPADEKLSKLSRSVGGIALAQAEYYFDVGAFPDFSAQEKAADRVEWMWNQGWVARLRSFRLSYKKADGPRQKKVDYDSEQAAFRDPSKPAAPAEDLGAFEGNSAAKDLKKLLDQGGSP